MINKNRGGRLLTIEGEGWGVMIKLINRWADGTHWWKRGGPRPERPLTTWSKGSLIIADVEWTIACGLSPIMGGLECRQSDSILRMTRWPKIGSESWMVPFHGIPDQSGCITSMVVGQGRHGLYGRNPWMEVIEVQCWMKFVPTDIDSLIRPNVLWSFDCLDHIELTGLRSFHYGSDGLHTGIHKVWDHSIIDENGRLIVVIIRIWNDIECLNGWSSRRGIIRRRSRPLPNTDHQEGSLPVIEETRIDRISERKELDMVQLLEDWL